MSWPAALVLMPSAVSDAPVFDLFARALGFSLMVNTSPRVPWAKNVRVSVLPFSVIAPGLVVDPEVLFVLGSGLAVDFVEVPVTVARPFAGGVAGGVGAPFAGGRGGAGTGKPLAGGGVTGPLATTGGGVEGFFPKSVGALKALEANEARTTK